MHISPDKMETYRATARIRAAEERRELALRHERAWSVARQAAEFLRNYRAVARLLALYPAFEIDLVMAEEAPVSLLARIQE